MCVPCIITIYSLHYVMLWYCHIIPYKVLQPLQACFDFQIKEVMICFNMLKNGVEVQNVLSRNSYKKAGYRHLGKTDLAKKKQRQMMHIFKCCLVFFLEGAKVIHSYLIDILLSLSTQKFRGFIRLT